MARALRDGSTPATTAPGQPLQLPAIIVGVFLGILATAAMIVVVITLCRQKRPGCCTQRQDRLLEPLPDLPVTETTCSSPVYDSKEVDSPRA